MADKRRKNMNWTVCGADGAMTYESASLATLMDIRDELQSINSKLNCYRVPRALDALHEGGKDIRRKQKLAATKRKNAKLRVAR